MLHFSSRLVFLFQVLHKAGFWGFFQLNTPDGMFPKSRGLISRPLFSKENVWKQDAQKKKNPPQNFKSN